MIPDRERKWADRIHYIAATALMTLALANVHSWLPAVAIIVCYFAVCASEAWIDGALRLHALAESAEDRL